MDSDTDLKDLQKNVQQSLQQMQDVLLKVFSEIFKCVGAQMFFLMFPHFSALNNVQTKIEVKKGKLSIVTTGDIIFNSGTEKSKH